MHTLLSNMAPFPLMYTLSLSFTLSLFIYGYPSFPYTPFSHIHTRLSHIHPSFTYTPFSLIHTLLSHTHPSLSCTPFSHIHPSLTSTSLSLMYTLSLHIHPVSCDFRRHPPPPYPRADRSQMLVVYCLYNLLLVHISSTCSNFLSSTLVGMYIRHVCII